MISLRPATWKRNKFALLILAWFIGSSGFASAQDESSTSSYWADANLNGSLRGSLWNVSKNVLGNNDLGIAELWLKASPHIGQDAVLVLDGWARNADVFHHEKAESVLREGYLSHSNGAADFRLGKQIIVWGRADQLNPTDNLSPRDNTLFMADSDDQRVGTFAIKTTYNFTDLALTGIVLPYFQPNKQPIAPASGVVYSESIPEGGQYAFKLEQSGHAVDWSLSYFQGFDLNPDISIDTYQPGALALSLQHNRVRVLGADAATVIGRYGLRTEAAYTWTEDAAGTDPFVKNPFFYAVAGADRTFFEYLNINLQYFLRQISNYNDPKAIADPLVRNVALQQAVASNQLESFQQGASLRISNKWLNETLEAEVAAVVNFTRRDYFVRPKISYSFDDHWKGALGANVFHGDSDTFFGLLQDRSSVFAEMRYNY
jgi:hypothetical protein